MGDIGYTALVLALIASIYAIVASVYGAKNQQWAVAQSARNAVVAVFGLVTVSVVVLLVAILSHDFELEYVASYTSRSMSPGYLITALWAGNTGSLLFWAWVLSILSLVAALKIKDRAGEIVPYASAVAMFTQAFFLILLLATANPFTQLAFIPPDGQGLNPMLENPGMVFHPPLLLAGYAGFTIPFAFALAALVTGRLDNAWVLITRRWMLITWIFLGVGNIIGAWWAYVELGWGGYWAWDSVENAGLMPWLLATAFLHSSMMQKRRGMLKVWNMALIILAFCLAIFGTFLTRSGVLQSVHTYPDTGLGPFFLGFLAIVFFGSLGLVFYRRNELRSDADMDSIVSRESTYLLNNVLLVGATLAILLGTVFPALTQAFQGVQVAVDKSFFNRVDGPLFLAIILLIGLCTLIGWKRPSTRELLKRFSLPFAVAVILGIALSIGVGQGYAVAAFSICAFVLVSILSDWLQAAWACHKARSESHVKAFFQLLLGNRPCYGGYIVHISVLLIAIGIIGSSFFSVSKEVVLKPGEATTIGSYTVTYLSKEGYQTAEKDVVTARLSVQSGGNPAGDMTSDKSFYQNFEQPVTEVGIRSNPVEDLYVILLGWDADGSTSFKLLVNPMVMWIWIGGIVFLAGGVVVFWPIKRRTVIEDEEPPVKAESTSG